MEQLTRKGEPYNWGLEQGDTFEDLKARLVATPILAFPD